MKNIHLIIVNLNKDNQFSTPESVLAHYFSLTGWAEGVTGAGGANADVKVTVFLRHPKNARYTRNGIEYRFIADKGPRHPIFYLPWRLCRQIREQCRVNQRAGTPTVIHVNGLLFPFISRVLATAVPAAVPVVGQHHGSLPWAAGLRRRWQRWGLTRLSAVFFATPELAVPWQKTGLLSDQQPIFALMETSSLLRYASRQAARLKTGLQGHPVLLWTGNLNSNKDPLTILAGVETLLHALPQARLYMAYREADLLPQVRERIASSPALSQAVTLLGPLPYCGLADYYNSADMFVQGSAKEGSGIAVLDALACGVIPVVTDIPSFRTLTENGRFGALWPVGDKQAFVAAVMAVWQRPLAAQSEAIRQYFQARWTFAAIGQQALDAYQEIWQRTQGRE